ncbi:putative duf1760-domain-containing protein [Rosellinia necatrix]|uniref:Putative duf1760-domain-containing protein n=1 Tax=Rosellinia necatrix TaxID=77044 RepID=A0A1W2TH83_ROSNE|nr:putative duf1760-domain-containing protein [Rosellinia necatrix]
MMPELSESIRAIRDCAGEDHFVYLTIVQYHARTPGILPTLNEALQDVSLTREIGWDLVETLITIDGCEDCLETVARLGNPREVIIKVMETMAFLANLWEDAQENDLDGDTTHTELKPGTIPDRLITLIGMLAILQRRIKTKYPSRFLAPSLVSVLEAYQPTPEMTTAVINLVRSLSGRVRPPLPTRTSSIDVANPDEYGDGSKNAPDPEAEQEDPMERGLNRKVLQSFTTCVLQRYINEHEVQWSPRLLEMYFPQMIIPSKTTITRAFREDEVLQKRDAVVGQLAALLRDLGMNDGSAAFVRDVVHQPKHVGPLVNLDTYDMVDNIYLSRGGTICLIAYWIFSTDAFGADNPAPEMSLFPEHLELLQLFLGENPQAEITNNPGIADALLAIGLGLYQKGSIGAGGDVNYMVYHHCLTLISVFHPDIQVRNAATRFAGTLLHADPDDESRRETLEDLLQNCQFPALNACAVGWLQEEIMAAHQNNTLNVFSTSDIIERLKFDLFPDMSSLVGSGHDAFAEFWEEHQVFLIQVANFAYFLFRGRADLVPVGLGAFLEQRCIEPLKTMAKNAETSPKFDLLPVQLVLYRFNNIDLH